MHNRLTINSSNISTNHPLLLANCSVIVHRGQYEFPTAVLFKGEVLRFLEMHRDVGLITGFQFLETELSYGPIFEIVVSPFPPVAVGLSE